MKKAVKKSSSGKAAGRSSSVKAASTAGKKSASGKAAATRSGSASSRSGAPAARGKAAGRTATTASRSATGRSSSASTGRKTTVAGRSASAPAGRGKSAGRTATKSSGGSASRAGKASSTGRSGASATQGAATKAANTRSSNPRRKTMTSREGLEKVFMDCLKDIYYAEKRLVTALKKMSKASSNDELKDAFDNHRQETEGQVEKLDQAFESLGKRAQGKKCEAMDGLLKEGDEHIDEYEKGPARDAALIVGGQKVEHYEIAAYGSLKTFAKILGYSECQQIFEEILAQESAADDKLTEVAGTVNQEAAREDGSNAGSSNAANGDNVPSDNNNGNKDNGYQTASSEGSGSAHYGDEA